MKSNYKYILFICFIISSTIIGWMGQANGQNLKGLNAIANLIPDQLAETARITDSIRRFFFGTVAESVFGWNDMLAQSLGYKSK